MNIRKHFSEICFPAQFRDFRCTFSAGVVEYSVAMDDVDAAQLAGWHTCQLIRDLPDNESRHLQVNRFDQIDLARFK